MKSSWVKARVLDASDRSYLSTVLTLLEQAGKEIILSLYLFETNDDAGPNHPVNRLAESLLQACTRGVRVRMLLNTNFRFVPKTQIGQGRYFERLMTSGVQVSTLLPSRRLHDKLILIDRRYVVDGSMNWSAAALLTNFESAVVIDSPRLAAQKLERIERLMIPQAPDEKMRDIPLLPVPAEAEISLVLFEKNYLPALVRTSDMRALDLYLVLIGQAAARGKKEFEADLETLGRALGLPGNWSRSQIRRQMIKVLRKLQNQYGFLKAEFPFGRNARVTLREFPGEKVRLPGYLFEAGYLAGASSGSQCLALAREVLKKEGASLDSFSASEIEKRFRIGASTVVRTRRTPVS